MRRLAKPDFDAGEVYVSCVGGVTDAAAVARYQSAAQSMHQLAQLYDDRAAVNQLYQFPAAEWGQNAQIVVGTVTKGDLTNLYTGHMAGRKQPARYYYDRLMLRAPLGKCPYCGFGHVSTLDHFLSKARYPSFSVLPINLVPSCSDCNYGKGSGVLDVGNQIPHPYYEIASIETDEWLFASVEETSPASIRYFVDTPNEWPDALATRVKNYFRDLDLASRFAVEAASELISLSDYLPLLATSDLIGTHLQQIAGTERLRWKNTWKAALYKTLAQSNWYLGGGWRPPLPL